MQELKYPKRPLRKGRPSFSPVRIQTVALDTRLQVVLICPDQQLVHSFYPWPRTPIRMRTEILSNSLRKIHSSGIRAINTTAFITHHKQCSGQAHPCGTPGILKTSNCFSPHKQKTVHGMEITERHSPLPQHFFPSP